MIANAALDYTEWAPPLSIEAVKGDIDAYESQFCRAPNKIIVWVHQWEYLTKRHKALVPQYILEKVEFDGFGFKGTMRPPESSDDATLWGVKVEVRDPEVHKP